MSSTLPPPLRAARPARGAVPSSNPLSWLEEPTDLDAVVIEALSQAVLFVDTDLVIRRVNGAAERLLGFPAGELVGSRVDDPSWPTFGEDGIPLPPSEQPAAKALRTGRRVENVVIGLFDPIGERSLWLLVSAVPVARPGERSPSALLVTLDDITDLRLTEAARRQSDARFRAVLETASLGVATMTVDGSVVSLNHAARRMLDLREDAVVARWQDLTLAEELADERLLFDELVARRREAYEVRKRVQRVNGAPRHLRISVTAARAGDDGADCFVALLQDITEQVAAERALRDSEERYRALFEHSGDIVTLLDSHGRLIYESPANALRLGYAYNELVGRPLLQELVHPDDQAATFAALAQLVAEPGATLRHELRVQGRDGAYHLLDATCRNLLHVPSVAGIVVNARDTTERRRLEAELLQAQKMETVGRLAGGIAHDFNNLLTAVEGNAALLLMRDLETDVAEGLRDILSASRRATELTRQLLVMSRQRGTEPTIVDVHSVILEIGSMLRRLIPENIELNVDPGVGMKAVRLGAAQLEQIVMNLVLNARDAVQPGGRIDVRAGRRISSGPSERHVTNRVLLSVTDNGCGFGEDVRARMFEPFFTTKQLHEGSGLGLSTVYGIVTGAGGTIEVESEPGRGSTFRILLPEAAVDTDSVDEVGFQPPQRAMAPAGTVLLAEDEEAVRTLTRRVLVRHGFRVLEAANGAEALAVLDAHAGPIELLLTDLVMPGMGGLELAARAAAKRPDMRVLFMSGYSEDAVDPGIVRDGRLLEKPFSPQHLTERVCRVLGRPQSDSAAA